MNCFISSVIVTILAFTTALVDYCDRSLCENTGGKPHIACNNDGSFVESCPEGARMLNITLIIPTILSEHNKGRNELAGGNLEGYESAARMATMQWDDELAEMAAFNVKKCECEYDGCRNVKRFTYTGQNIHYMGYTGRESFYSDEEIIRNGTIMWFAEYVNGTMDGMRNYPRDIEVYGPFSHFALFVAEGNTHVGCAASRFVEDNYNILLLTCNYATAPLQSYPIYKDGPPTSECKTGSNTEYTNLCSTDEVYLYV